MSQATHVYVGAKDCGCRVCVVTDMPEHKKFTAKTVSQYVRDGYAVTRETFEAYRDNPVRHCSHERQP